MTGLKSLLVVPKISLNAPFGARCFMTSSYLKLMQLSPGLNAPFGARCFMTDKIPPHVDIVESLNAPFGARCFMT